MKVKLLNKEYKIEEHTMYEIKKFLDKGIHNTDDLMDFLNYFYGEELTFVLVELFDYESLLQFVTDTLPSVLRYRDIELNISNNFKTINKVYNTIKKGEQEYGTQIL